MHKSEEGGDSQEGRARGREVRERAMKKGVKGFDEGRGRSKKRKKKGRKGRAV